MDLQEAGDTSGSFCAVAKVASLSASSEFTSVLTLMEAAPWLWGGPAGFIYFPHTDKSWWQVSEAARPLEPWCHTSRGALIRSPFLLSKSPQTPRYVVFPV